MRVYAKGTRDALLPLLPTLDVDATTQFKSQEEFSEWFDGHVERIAKTIDRHNRRNTHSSWSQMGPRHEDNGLYVRDPRAQLAVLL